MHFYLNWSPFIVQGVFLTIAKKTLGLGLCTRIDSCDTMMYKAVDGWKDGVTCVTLNSILADKIIMCEVMINVAMSS